MLRKSIAALRSVHQSSQANRPLQLETLESRRLLAFNPTGAEQEFLQLVNRYRTDPKGEFNRLFESASPLKSRDPVLQNDLDFANVNGNVLRSELNAVQPTPPVTWNEPIHEFASAHNAKMIARKQQFHSNSTERRETLQAAGVNFRFANGEKFLAENVFGFGQNPLHSYAGYMVDWLRGAPDGMQAGRPHRVSFHNGDFDQAGVALTPYTGSGFGPQVSSFLLANIEDPGLMVTGAIFEDTNSSGWYEDGEGLSSVKFVFEGEAGTFETTGYTTGGYAIKLPAGTYNATATGGGMKFAQKMANIVVEDGNVWQNWIYDPDKIPPDNYESNNSRNAATDLGNADTTLRGLSIHSTSDVDFFRFKSPGTGPAKIDVNFSNANGDLDVQVLNSSGTVLASASSTTNNESVTTNVNRDAEYFVRVYGKDGARNGAFSITVDVPEPAAPAANADRASLNGTATVTVDVIANDTDLDGDRTKLVPSLAAGVNQDFSIKDNKVVYEPANIEAGVHRATYTVTDDQGLESGTATISVFVIDYSVPTPWKNAGDSLDINDDGTISPLDALLVVNDLNVNQARKLPDGSSGGNGLFGFLDPTGDGFISPRDALQVINKLNADGEGESSLSDDSRTAGQLDDDYATHVDAAFAGWSLDFELDRKKKSQ